MSEFSRLSKVALLPLLGSAVLTCAQPARADDPSAAPADAAGESDPSTASALQEITVQAQRTTENLAREAQEQAPNLINIMTATQMQKLPDVNTGEAIRRVPGISLETDTGEGRYINIRGLDADLNSTTFGGLRLPPTNNSSPSGAGRAVAFDSIPVGFVGAITVTKTNLPEQDAEALGGTIDITPKTAPPGSRSFADAKLGTGYEDLRHTWIIDGAITAGTRFGGSGDYQPFSILVTAALYTDRRGIDDAEAGFTDQEPAIPDKAFAAFEQRYYRYRRERHGYGMDLGYQPDANNQWFVRYYDSGYSETVLRNRLVWNFNQAPTIDPANPNGFLDTANFDKTLRDEKEYLKTRVFEIGGKSLINSATLDYHVGYTRGSYEKPYDYNSDFANPTFVPVAYDNTTLPNWPTVRAIGAVPSDPAGYTLNSIYNQTQHSSDHEWGIGINLSIPTTWTGFINENVKVGLNARLRSRVASAQNFSAGDLPALPLTAAVTGSNILFYEDHYLNGPQVDASVIRGIYNAATITDDTTADAQSYQNDRENVYAAYGQYQFGFGPVGIIGGLRVENTKATYAANNVDNQAGTITPISRSNSYTNVFPSAQARYELTSDTIVRGSASSTIARPGFNQATAATTRDPGGTVSTGNPDLKPVTATSLDLSIERYLPHAGIASFGLFDKEINNYIVTREATLPYSSNGGFAGLERTFTYFNAPHSRAFGTEANYEQHFADILPGPLSGLGVSANWTWVQSSFEIRPGEISVLPSTSRNTANAQLLYSLQRANLTLGAYFVSRNIFGVGSAAATDVWSQKRLSLDFGSQFTLRDPFSLYLNVKNLTNTPLKFTEGPGDNRVIQREFYGITVQAGFNYNL